MDLKFRTRNHGFEINNNVKAAVDPGFPRRDPNPILLFGQNMKLRENEKKLGGGVGVGSKILLSRNAITKCLELKK